jgi:hypothetical protein
VENYEYAIYMMYLILSVLVLAFVIYILPSLVGSMLESLEPHWEKFVEIEWVERLLLAIEELREWQSEPGRHRPQTSGVHHAHDTYFQDLNKMWREVEDTLRVDIDFDKKETANVR